MDRKLQNMMTLKLKYMNCINIKVLSDTNKIEVSNKLPLGIFFKYFIGYKSNKKLDPYVYSFQK